MIDKISTREAYGKKLAELDNDKIIVLTADLAESTRVKDFAKKYPDRFIQVGISEQDMFGIANGLALEGMIPITNTFAAFCLRGYEQIRLIAINNSNVKIIGHHSGISLGQDGVSQMCEEDISAFRTMPNFTVIVPCDALETQKALVEIIKNKGPCYLRLSREPGPIITNEYTEFEIGKANILKNGEDILIVSCGLMVSESLKAANILSEKGISACVMNMHTIKPLDVDSLLKYSNKCKAVITVEEHSIYGGLGSAVVEALSLSRIPIKILGINDKFGESGKPQELFKKFGLTAENIVEYCLDVLRFKEKNSIQNIASKEHIKEIKDIIKNINHETSNEIKKYDENKEEIEENKNKYNPDKNKYDFDPRRRIVKMSEKDKEKVNNILYKMFGGRKN